MEPYYITEENCCDAYEATRDILFLYHDAVTSYGGFGHNLQTGTFDAFLYVKALLAEPPGISFGLDIDLLQEGSAVSLLCILSDCWDELNEVPVGRHELTGRLLMELNDGLFDFVPLAKKAANLAYKQEDEFREILDQVYQEYIVKYYISMASQA